MGSTGCTRGTWAASCIPGALGSVRWERKGDGVREGDEACLKGEVARILWENVLQEMSRRLLFGVVGIVGARVLMALLD